MILKSFISGAKNIDPITNTDLFPFKTLMRKSNISSTLKILKLFYTQN